MGPFASVPAGCQLGTGGLVTVPFRSLVFLGVVGDRRGAGIRRTAWSRPGAERGEPNAFAFLGAEAARAAAEPGGAGLWPRAPPGSSRALRRAVTRSGRLLVPGVPASRALPSVPWTARRRRGAGRRPGLPGVGGRTLPCARGSGAGAAQSRDRLAPGARETEPRPAGADSAARRQVERPWS